MGDGEIARADDDAAGAERAEVDEVATALETERAWIVYRDAQTKSIVETYGHMEGTMWIPMSASAVMELTKDRALLLQSLKETISER